MTLTPRFLLINLGMFLLALLLWRAARQKGVQGVAPERDIRYPAQSLLLFACFPLLLYPFAILATAVGVEIGKTVLTKIWGTQALTITTLYNYVLYGKTYPAVIGTYFVIGLLFHALAGLAIGLALRNRLTQVRPAFRLLGSLFVFESALTLLMAYLMRSTLWLEVWHLPAGW